MHRVLAACVRMEYNFEKTEKLRKNVLQLMKSVGRVCNLNVLQISLVVQFWTPWTVFCSIR